MKTKILFLTTLTAVFVSVSYAQLPKFIYPNSLKNTQSNPSDLSSKTNKAVISELSNRIATDPAKAKNQGLDTILSHLKAGDSIAQQSNTNDTILDEYTAYKKTVGLSAETKIDPQAAYAYVVQLNAKINNELAQIDSCIKILKNTSKQPDNQNLENSINQSRENILLYRDARDYFYAINCLEGAPKIHQRFFPIRSIMQAKFFYLGDNDTKNANVDLLSNFAIQSDFGNKSMIQSDLISGIVPITKRVPVKLDLSTTISQNNDSLKSDQSKSKVLYGGLVHGTVTYPLFYSNWIYDHKKNRGLFIYVPLTGTLNFDNVSSRNDQALKDAFYFGELAAALYVQSDLIQNKSNTNVVSVFFNSKFAFIDGGSSFYDNLNTNRTGFWLAQINAGIKIKDRVTFAVNIPVYCSNKDVISKQNATIGFTIDPNFLKK